jgi:hypothetical protein
LGEKQIVLIFVDTHGIRNFIFHREKIGSTGQKNK